MSHLQLVALTAHCLDENGKVEHTASADNPLVHGTFHRADTQGKVFLQFLVQAFADVAGSTELSLFAEEGRVVDGEEHAHRRLIHGDGRQWLRIVEVGNGVADLEFLQTDYGTYVAGIYMVRFLVPHTLESVEFLDFRAFLCAVAVTDGDVLSVFQCAAVYTAYGDASCIA